MIAVLGWGSLIWDPRELVVHGDWQTDGPSVRVDFLRRSSGSRVTLVLHDSAPPVTSLWIYYEGMQWEPIRDMLAVREGVAADPGQIRHWVTGEPAPSTIPNLNVWALTKHVDHVLWTGLPPRWNKIDGTVPTAAQVLGFLSSLDPEKSVKAEEYVRRTPLQISTPIRLQIENQLGWLPRAAKKDGQEIGNS